ncbi:hypothetical protein BS50DRAFT_571535 [Corynespora cassiicola Philippines]|uniref:Uncharacterized protein n=1 Tax=Corynespora cassiicola Philippines TaxID=1448308 RepID=A0A2T2NXU5_CORCC|nr:hypothetical protein BS50DRAFT_571535 [Corynespora cassiicola Philippines]
MSSSPHPSKSPRSPPVPQFEDAPPPQDYPEHGQTGEGQDEDDEIPYPEPGSEHTLLPPPNFNPFFTLVEDTTSGEHYHPYVHYIFTDDDPVIVTAAAMRSLGLDDAQYLPQPEAPEREQNVDEYDEEQEQEPQAESPLPPTIPGVKEHYLLVDIAADGHTVVDAQSLSPEWQITDASVRTAPSFEEGSLDGSYMLRIEGVDIPGKRKGKAKGQPGEIKLKDARDRTQGDIFGALDGLVKRVDGGLEVAEKIAGRAEDVRESEGTVLDVGGEDKGKRRASEV